MIPAAAITSNCPQLMGQARTPTVAAIAIAALGRSGQRLPAIPHTASATTATAAAFNPLSHPALSRSPKCATP